MKQLTINTYDVSFRNADIDAYLNDIRKYKPLTIERENELARKAKQGDNRAKELLINSNLLFVVSVAKHYQHMGLDILDIISEGNIGLCKAIEDYNETLGNKFITFAVTYIRQEIMKALDRDSRLVRLPQHRIKNEESTSISFNTPLGGVDEDKTLLDTFASDMKANGYDREDEISTKIAYALSKVSEKERDIICALFGIGRKEESPYTLSKRYGLTEERIRQIKWEAIEKVRKA